MNRKKKIPQNKRDWYRNTYLLSEHWKGLRARKLAINPVCEVCGKKHHLDVHHRRYKAIYDVLLEDLQTLCRRCHNSRHKFLDSVRKKMPLRKTLRGFRRLIRG